MRTLSLQRVSSLLVVCVVSLLLQSACTSHAVAQDPSNFTIGQGAYLLVAPIDWKRVPPKTSIVETEFSIPANRDGRRGERGRQCRPLVWPIHATRWLRDKR